jgi:hypothetical protein
MRLEHEPDRSPPSNLEIKNAWMSAIILFASSWGQLRYRD